MSRFGKKLIEAAEEALAVTRGTVSAASIRTESGKHFRLDQPCREIAPEETVMGTIEFLSIAPIRIGVRWSVGLVQEYEESAFEWIDGAWETRTGPTKEELRADFAARVELGLDLKALPSN